MSESIANMVSKIRNGYLAGKTEVEIPYSKFKEVILNVLFKEGFLARVGVENSGSKKALVAKLKYEGKMPGLTKISVISNPGLKVYEPAIRVRKKGLAKRIISTSSGAMTDKEAFKKRLGGEVILEVY